MEIIQGTSLRSRFALFMNGVDSEKSRKHRRFVEPSRLPMKRIKHFLERDGCGKKLKLMY